VRFSRTRIAENEHILVAIDELSLQQKPDLLRRQPMLRGKEFVLAPESPLCRGFP
jgi:hypothetical protein